MRRFNVSQIILGIRGPDCLKAFQAYYIDSPIRVVPVGECSIDYNCSPLITDEPKARFYAAAPILTSDGYALGVVCVVDRKPPTIQRIARPIGIATNGIASRPAERAS